MKFDFTPDPKVLIALTHTQMKPIDALCELIDNAVDSFYAAKIQGVPIENPLIVLQLPTLAQLKNNNAILRIQDNGPGMTADAAEKSIKAGFSGNNPYDTLGLFGMGFNISTGKIGNKTTLMTARRDSKTYIKTVIDLEKINEKKNYSLDAEELPKDPTSPFGTSLNGTIIEVSDWWPEGNANHNFLGRLIKSGLPKIRAEIGRRYASILRMKEVRIVINGEECKAFEHCVWDETRYVVRNGEQVPAKIHLNKVVGTKRRCLSCTAVVGSGEYVCPECGSIQMRTIEEKVTGWVGIQRYDDLMDFGIDVIRNGRAILTAEKDAFFNYVDEFKKTTKEYPIDQLTGRIVGEIHLDFVPVDFTKQDFQRSSDEWERAMNYVRGNGSLRNDGKGGNQNDSPVARLVNAYRRVRTFGRKDMYMGYWDEATKSPKRISRDVEKEYKKKFDERIPGFYDDSEWWKLVEQADQPPVEELPECPECGAQNVKEAEVCSVCGTVLKGKLCLNESCRMRIPLSAKSCPHCGESQVPVLMTPWTCEVCKTKNISTNLVCKKCGRAKGTHHPLSEQELLLSSDKVDSLSVNELTIALPNGEKTKPVNVVTYASRKPLISPEDDAQKPLVVFKDIGGMRVFLDLSHPYFSRCGLSREQIVASEAAAYFYSLHANLASNYSGYNMAALTWTVMDTAWGDSMEITSESIESEINDLFSEIIQRLQDGLGETAALYFDSMNEQEKMLFSQSLIRNNIDLEDTGTLKATGRYLEHVPHSFLLTLYDVQPDVFFGGKVWKTSLANGGAEFLGSAVIEQARRKAIAQYRNCLQDIISFEENLYQDLTTLRRVRLSAEFLRKGLA